MKRVLFIIVTLAFVSSVQAYSRQNEGVVFENGATGTKMAANDVFGYLVIGPAMKRDQEQGGQALDVVSGRGGRQEAEWNRCYELLGSDMERKNVSIKLAQQAAEAQRAAEAEAKKATEEVANLKAELSGLRVELATLNEINQELKKQNATLLQLLEQRDAEIASLKKENTLLKGVFNRIPAEVLQKYAPASP